MKGKNIRKENVKKPVRPPVDHDAKFNFLDQGVEYRITHNNQEAEVRLRGTDELVGVYKAATRDWKKIRLRGFLTHNVRIRVENLYV